MRCTTGAEVSACYPPMSGRAFRDYFYIEDRDEGEGSNLRLGSAHVTHEDDPTERCDFDEDEHP